MSWEPTKITCKCGSVIETRWTSELNDWQTRHQDCLKPIDLPPGFVYTPIKSEWRGLDDDDKKQISKKAAYEIWMTAGEYAGKVQSLTEERLKEKNNA